jgi:hypothetical protein
MANDEGNVLKAKVWVCDACRFFQSSLRKRSKTPLVGNQTTETVIIANTAVSSGNICLRCGIPRTRVLTDSNSVNLTIDKEN